jgi:hypothetical protein
MPNFFLTCLRNFVALHLQIKDCMTRYNGDSDQQRRKKFSFPARLICADCFEVKITINCTVHLINQTERDRDMYTEADCNCFSDIVPQLVSNVEYL